MSDTHHTHTVTAFNLSLVAFRISLFQVEIKNRLQPYPTIFSLFLSTDVGTYISLSLFLLHIQSHVLPNAFLSITKTHLGTYLLPTILIIRTGSLLQTQQQQRMEIFHLTLNLTHLLFYLFHGALLQEEKKDRIGPKVKQFFVMVLYAPSVIFCCLINTTAYHLGRYEPSSPSSKELHGSSI